MQGLFAAILFGFMLVAPMFIRAVIPFGVSLANAIEIFGIAACFLILIPIVAYLSRRETSV